MKYLHVELPSLHLVWQRDGCEDVVCSVIRTNYPKPSALLVPAIMRQVKGLEVEAVDMKIRDQKILNPYRSFPFEGGYMVASRMGMPFGKLEYQLRQADFLGLTVNPSSWANIALDFAWFARKINPQLKIILGGTDAMFRFEHYLQSKAIDFVIRGEGEITGPALLEALMNDKDYSEIRGLAFVDEGKILDTGIVRNCDLDAEPLSALDLFVDDMPLWATPIEYYVGPEVQAPIASLYITRGCNQACDYCTTPRKYGSLRFKSLARVEAELKHFKKFGVKTINIWDDSLSSLIRCGERELLLAYVRMIRQYGFSFEYAQGMVIRDLWNVEKGEPDFVLIEELFRHKIVNGKFVGCYGQYTPLEFLQEENTTAMNSKLLAYDQELAVIRAICEQGVRYMTFSCILGRSADGPSQVELARQRLSEVKKLVEGYGVKALITPYIYSMFPGTKIWKNERSRLVYSIDKFPELYQLNASPHGTEHFSPGELMRVKMELEKEFLGKARFADWIKTGRYQW